MSSPHVFITGATGSQGSALARRLLAAGWAVHSTTRDPAAPRAATLTAAGLRFTAGDWDNGDALRAAMTGCTKLFLCLMSDIASPDSERERCRAICDIAREVGITQVVSSTSLGASMFGTDDRLQPGTLLYDLLRIKKDSEAMVEAGPWASYTLLRPAYFMINFLEPNINFYAGLFRDGVWSTCLKPDTRLGLIDHEDIAAVAAAALDAPDAPEFKGKAIGLVSEFLSPQDTMDVLGNAMGSSFKTSFLSEEEIDALPYGPMVLIHLERSMRYMPEYVDMDRLREITPLTPFKTFLEREKEHVKKL
ncbi:NmrA family protein [Melanomma pulvis-pyrius CBS 109.77]|uniref:NmrA family protein n=1 Tax=Melanomma pulvis-pyrius CBS 109.77 TaxID=1314802 RepID=A0A6A6X1B1_9PLEO|nr:NmrA family protein [Melanomma pulvis-pyrius CBS 109.77]